MKNLPRISVCIANYNGERMIEVCLDSVLAQRGGFTVEIIVHDDASSDASVEIIKRNYPAVNLIQSVENVGFCIANNRMAAVAHGDYLLLLNNDATLFPDALSTLLAEAQRLGKPAIMSLPQFNDATLELIDIGCLLDPFLNPVPNREATRNDVGMVIGACFWVDRCLWEELGGFPEWFGSIGEDLYLCCRARLAGYMVRALNVSGYCHRVGQSFGGGKVTDGRLHSTFRRRALTERNKTIVMAIAYPAPFMQLILPLHLLLLILEGMALSLLKLEGRYLREIYLPVFGALIRQRRKWYFARREVQKKRSSTCADFYGAFTWVPYKLCALLRHGVPRLE